MASVNVGSEGDSPVAINVTPLVDIIFCLCVFFMISFRFKQIEGRFDAWLPRTTGVGPGPVNTSDLLSEVRVALFWDETAQRTVRKLGSRRVDSDDELGQLLQEAHDAYVRLNQPDAPATIDAEARVPWNDVVKVLNLCKKSRIDRIEFALQAPPEQRR
jgi:biopolymer transport protein ExbD